MKTRDLAQILSTFALLLFLFSACGSAQPTPTPTSPPPPPTATHTSIPPTATYTPTEIPASVPDARSYQAMAFDTESNMVILYGGQAGNILKKPETCLQDTWAFDMIAREWTNLQPSTWPTVCTAMDMVYDAESDRVILYGGVDAKLLSYDETWAYDFNSNAWEKKSAGPTGDKHMGARLAYDAESDRVVLFGGYDWHDTLATDTWVYDYNTDTWTEMHPGSNPPGRNYQGISYDAHADRVLVWGGYGLDGKPVDKSVWAYDFNSDSWQEFLPVDPNFQIKDYARLVYDSESDRTLLIGGYPTSSEVCAYDYNTNTWEKYKPADPPTSVSRHVLVYSPDTDRVLLFGGETNSGKLSQEFWAYDLNTNTWEKLTP